MQVRVVHVWTRWYYVMATALLWVSRDDGLQHDEYEDIDCL